ncbi:MAG: PadR family transcriptional regulator [Deltaproteobacteria bacterium]|nr:PadR family transcriptional regulator [Deltaproteobacteria bacterium]
MYDKKITEFQHRNQNVTESLVFTGVVRGMLPMYLLSLLQEKSLHGTEIMQAIAAMSGGTWKPSPGSVYPLLKKLEEDGFIQGEWKSGRAAATRVYTITDEGRKGLPEIRRRILGQLQEARETIDRHILVMEKMLTGTGEGHGDE